MTVMCVGSILGGTGDDHISSSAAAASQQHMEDAATRAEGGCAGMGVLRCSRAARPPPPPLLQQEIGEQMGGAGRSGRDRRGDGKRRWIGER